MMATKNICYAVLVASLLTAHQAPAQSPASQRAVTQGRAKAVLSDMFKCPGGSLVRPVAVGSIAASDGSTWTVPAEVQYTSATRAPDLYNECAHATPASLKDVRVDDVPIVTIDPDGETITGYLIADNSSSSM
jgi:hypothetical protein